MNWLRVDHRFRVDAIDPWHSVGIYLEWRRAKDRGPGWQCPLLPAIIDEQREGQVREDRR